ncbi:MAG TPA: M13 family metallopeptidase [Longimicrobium sp.]|nr:M13 family metallopeptidase [Longimicrobium sp.]
MHPSRIIRPVLLLALGLAACAPVPRAALDPAPDAASAEGRGIDRANMDTSCSACRDFYRYANGGWLDRNPVPADRSSWSGYSEAADRTTQTLRALLEDAARQAEAGASGATGRLGTFYASCMDTARIDALGISPIQAELARVAALRDRGALAAELARLHRSGVWVPFDFGVTPDEMNSTVWIAGVWPGGTVLPERGYYLREDSASVAFRTQYQAHVARMLRLAGDPDEQAETGARQVLRMETAFAQAMLSRQEAREPRATYHPLPLDSLRAMVPEVDWAAYLAALGAPRVESLNVAEPAFVRALGRMLREEPLDAWRTLLRWRILNDQAQSLSSEIANADWTFFSAFSGARQRAPRWRRCIDRTNGVLGPELGRIYGERTFTPVARARAEEMIANLRAVREERIEALSWMGPATREQARAKLRALDVLLGYPDSIPDFSMLRLSRGDYLGNLRAARAHDLERGLAQIGGRVDRAEWRGLPQSTSGWYSPSYHQLTYPAGKFQPPFFDPLADDAVNYGALGATIAHEIVHGFDDQGRQYDAAGNLRDWWTPEDDARFRTLAEGLVAQYAAYTVLDTVHVNGRLTLGENIADLGGVTLAYHAFQRAQRGKPRRVIDGLTPEQRFFISWAQNWRENERPEAERTAIRTDPHSPSRYRLIGTLSNLPEFAAAFGCRPGDPMVRDESVRVRIW